MVETRVRLLGSDPRSRGLTRRAVLQIGLLAPVLAACGASNTGEAPRLAAASENTTLGPGDLFRMEIVGEPDLPTEFQVAADGTVTFPYIHEMKVAGLEPQEVSQRVRKALIEK